MSTFPLPPVGLGTILYNEDLDPEQGEERVIVYYVSRDHRDVQPWKTVRMRAGDPVIRWYGPNDLAPNGPWRIEQPDPMITLKPTKSDEQEAIASMARALADLVPRVKMPDAGILIETKSGWVLVEPRDGG